MGISINFPGHIEHLTLAKSNYLMPVFEAVVNSIQSLQETKEPNRAIVISVIREVENQTVLAAKSNPIKSFTITDNGLGFTDKNFSSFSVLDSSYKAPIGGKGVGRLLWLKAFNKVEIDSTYSSVDGSFRQRQFSFLISDSGIENVSDNASEATQASTTISLQHFLEPYKSECTDSTELISKKIFEHCLQYLLVDSPPSIIVSDQQLGHTFTLQDFLGKLASRSQTTFQVKGHNFTITHLKSPPVTNEKHKLHYCGNGRVVTSEYVFNQLGRINSSDTSGESHVYTGYITSDYLDENVNRERNHFSILPGGNEGEFDFPETPTIADIKNHAVESARGYLDEPLRQSQLLSAQLLDRFLEENPQYSFMRDERTQLLEEIAPTTKMSEVEMIVFKRSKIVESKVRERLLEQATTIGSSWGSDNGESYREAMKELVKKDNEIGKAKLAEYISHRYAILKLLSESISKIQGRRVREDVLHNLIYPMKKTSEETDYNDHNLWLIDERLSYHSFLASDKPLKSDKSDHGVRPDLLILDNPLTYSEATAPDYGSLLIVEFKRPIRDEYSDDENPWNQITDYLWRLRNGKTQSSAGRPITVSQSTPIFCFVIADFTEKLRKIMSDNDIKTSVDVGRRFRNHDEYNAYIEFIDYDALLKIAQRRNRILFEKLGLPNHGF